MVKSEVIRVGVIDDHPLLREGVVRTLDAEADIEIVGEGGSSDEAFAVATQFMPDVMLIDMNMPGTGLDAIARISKACPAVRLIVLTVREDHDAVTAAMELGASGYVLKGVGGKQLISIVRDIHDGGAYVSPTLAAKLLTDLGGAKRAGKAEEASLDDLTAREEKILSLIARGMSNKEIGRELDIREKTVKHYVTNILGKLHLRNRVEAAIFMQRASETPKS